MHAVGSNRVRRRSGIGGTDQITKHKACSALELVRTPARGCSNTMRDYSYIPFQGELSALNGNELACLNQVCEGWYVDYKERLPSVEKLAKHLSAFANQHGGWLFIGVKEDPQQMTAAAFPGVPASDVSEILVRLRDAASAHCHPPIYFEHKVIHGPVPELSLEQARVIVIVGVPEGPEPPYVHSSGRIYRRLGDQSEPKPETDRHVLDLLWSRRQDTQRRLARFLEERPQISENEKAGPLHAYVFLLADPLLVGRQLGLSLEAFAGTMMSRDEPDIFSITFDNVFPTADSFIARQVEDNNPFLEGLTFRWWHNGNARVSVPINVHQFASLVPQLDPMQKDFLDAITQRGFVSGRIAEFSMFLAALNASVDKYSRLRKLGGLHGPFYGKIRICDAWRVIPYLNMGLYIETIKEYGFPVVQDTDIFCPPGLSRDSFVVLDETVLPPGPGRAFLTCLPLAVVALYGVGIPLGEMQSKHGSERFNAELFRAANGSIKPRVIR